MKYPVLAYHKISYQWEISFTMMYPAQFEKQMRYLAKKGYVGCSLKEYLADPKDNYFVLTFDDAYESVFTYALPVLKELGFHASVFVLSKYIGELNTWDFSPGNILSRHMNAVQLRELHQIGWEIASHGENHRVMVGMNPDTVSNELSHSKEIIESIIGDKIETFCFPFGVYNPDVVAAAKTAGYEHLVGFIGHSRYGVISRSVVYRFVDNRFSVLRKIRINSSCRIIENMKEFLFHSFSLLTRLKQKLS